VENHKLQTLVKHLEIDGGQAHRAYDDAKACLQVGLKCFEKMAGDGASATTLASAIKSQGKNLWWRDYSLMGAHHGHIQTLMAAIHDQRNVDMIYDGGSLKGKTRPIKPIGIVRNPDGDYLMAMCLTENISKRYYLSRIKDVA
jgi:DNA polymerase-3 subunit epsilon